MTFNQKYQLAQNWVEKVKIINLYHKLKLFKNKKWTIRKTADYFKLSIGLISENIMLGNHLDIIESCCSSRKEALELIKKKYE